MIILKSQFHISAKAVLQVKIDLDTIEPKYVLLYHTGIVTRGFLVKIVEAINYMAKFGWSQLDSVGTTV